MPDLPVESVEESERPFYVRKRELIMMGNCAICGEVHSPEYVQHYHVDKVMRRLQVGGWVIEYSARCRERHPDSSNWMLRSRCINKIGHSGKHRVNLATGASWWYGNAEAAS